MPKMKKIEKNQVRLEAAILQNEKKVRLGWRPKMKKIEKKLGQVGGQK